MFGSLTILQKHIKSSSRIVSANKVDKLVQLRKEGRYLLSRRFAGVVEGTSLAGGESHGMSVVFNVFLGGMRARFGVDGQDFKH